MLFFQNEHYFLLFAIIWFIVFLLLSFSIDLENIEIEWIKDNLKLYLSLWTVVLILIVLYMQSFQIYFQPLLESIYSYHNAIYFLFVWFGEELLKIISAIILFYIYRKKISTSTSWFNMTYFLMFYFFTSFMFAVFEAMIYTDNISSISDYIIYILLLWFRIMLHLRMSWIWIIFFYWFLKDKKIYPFFSIIIIWFVASVIHSLCDLFNTYANSFLLLAISFFIIIYNIAILKYEIEIKKIDSEIK